MGSKSDALENVLLDFLYGQGGGILAFGETLSIALYTETPTDAGGGVEVAGIGYERKTIDNTPEGGTFAPAVEGVKRNLLPIEFTAAGAGGWGVIVAFAIFAPIGEGLMLHWGAVDPPVEVTEGDVFRIPTGGLVISED